MIGSKEFLGTDVVQVPGWEEYRWLRHGFSTRGGGVSTVYGPGSAGELNLGWTREDDPAAVAENRRRFVEAAGGGGELALVTIRQVHGAVVRAVRNSDGALEGRLRTAAGGAVLEGDGLVTGVAGVLLGIQTADCVPVLVVDVKRREGRTGGCARTGTETTRRPLYPAWISVSSSGRAGGERR